MRDLQPVASLIAWTAVVLAFLMLFPAALDLADGNENWRGFLLSAFLTFSAGLGVALTTRGTLRAGMSRRQAFLLTVLVWAVLPLFGALPFVLGTPAATYTDAYFEAMSGMTTTGATVFAGLDDAPRGFLLWRAMTQWLGGVGIVVFATVFLPMMRIGGMQFFRSEAFDLSVEVTPRATEAALQLGGLYVGLTAACMLAYSAAGMSGFDALSHAMTTVSTGGMANYNTSFAAFPPLVQLVAVPFMWLAALPFLRLLQFGSGRFDALWRDDQVRAFIGLVLTFSGAVALWLVLFGDYGIGAAGRAALFNVSSIMTGTGYATADYTLWGGFPVAVIFMVGLIGGCTGSTSCSAKVFRYLVLYKALIAQIRRIHMPHGIYPLRINNRPVEPEVVSSVMAFFFVFAGSLTIWAILLSLLGLDLVSAISGSVGTLANIGPALGPIIGPAGNYAPVPDTAKWLMSFGMLLGRLEFLSVLVVLTPMFWSR